MRIHPDIDRAQRWIALGQPVLVAKRNQSWTPEMPGREFNFPKNWQSITVDECDLSAFEDGDSIIAPCGWTFDVIDIDTKLGEQVDRSCVPPEVEVYGEHRTPSGGYHLFVKKLGYSKNNSLTFNGIHVGDYLAGTENGAGRAFVYLPGTQRPRYGGAGYQVIREVDLEKLIDSDSDPLLESVVMRCGSSRIADVGRQPASSEQLREFRDSFQYQIARCDYGRAVVKDSLSSHVAVGTRHNWFVKTMMRFIELVKTGCCSTQDIIALRAKFAEVMPEGGTDADEVEKYAIANTRPVTNSGCSIHSGKEPVLLDMSDPAVKERSRRHGELSWTEFWKRGDDQAKPDLVHGIIQSGKSITMFSKAGAGKSLLMLEWAVKIARGESIVGYRSKPAVVMYLDQENPEDTIRDRLEVMGYGPEDDMSNLHYYLHGEWPPLNTLEGADSLMAEVMRLGADVVIVDTLSKFVVGDENESSTYLDLNRQIGVRLRREEVSFVRLDHSGKDADKGTRGSSAKQADVDTEYQLTASPFDPTTNSATVVMKRTKDRTGLGEAEVVLDRFSEPMRHEMRDSAEDMKNRDQIEQLIELMDKLCIPVADSRRKVQAVLSEQGVKVRAEALGGALKVRRSRHDLATESNG